MPVPVVVVLPAKGDFDQDLRNWAVEAATTLSDGELSKLLSGFAKFCRIDRDYAPIPIGKAVGVADTLEDYDVKISETFCLRAWVDAAGSYADLVNIPLESEGKFIFADPLVVPSTTITCWDTKAKGTTNTVRQNLGVAKLAEAGLDGTGVAIAIMDDGINVDHLKERLGEDSHFAFDTLNSWNPCKKKLHEAGDYPTGHGTMCAYDALIAAPKATLLDYPVHFYPVQEGNITKRLLSTALQGLERLMKIWKATRSVKYRGLVLSHSWGVARPDQDLREGDPGRYVDNPYHIFNKLLRTLSKSGVDIVTSAGNCGEHCPQADCMKAQPILGARALDRVLTVGGCDTDGACVGYSSRGPSIKPMAPDESWNMQKPDVLAYTHFVGSEAGGAGTADTGTSTSAPVAAGCVAALRTNASWEKVPSQDMVQIIKGTARQITGSNGTWNRECGYGIIDALAAARELHLVPGPA